ncbi:bifunctional DNA primase/polymerase [Pseudonocardia sp. KRD291]|uniref:bifunctional DNA primase/polymerase n=1 Tax=Pseudonocardia sp. KRD291 TaxID=2792007 RepID=UPI0027E26B6E|nr:bifunctional DNA primase/polymerase [Pseudonocardia sp. KRD291]
MTDSAGKQQNPETLRLRKVALEAAEAGLFVFPVREGSKLPAFHGKNDCKGRGVCADGHQGWEQRSTRDPEQIRRWWSQTPWNVGIACGPSRLLVIDLDVLPERGVEWKDLAKGWPVLDRVAAAHGAQIPATYAVTTPSGGGHLYYRMPDGLELRNTQGGVGHSIGPLVDTRAGGGFVVGAGSVRPEGRYTVAFHGVIEDLPGWLADLLSPPPQPEPRAVPLQLSTRRANAYIAAILDAEADNVSSALKGQRQITLLNSARTLGRLVGGRELDEDNAREVLLQAATVHIGVDGMTRGEVERTIDRGVAYGKQAPRTIERRSDERDGENGSRS